LPRQLPTPGPQNGRQFSAPAGGPTTLKENQHHEGPHIGRGRVGSVGAMKNWRYIAMHTVAAAAFIFLLQRYALSASLESSLLWALTFGGCAAGSPTCSPIADPEGSLQKCSTTRIASSVISTASRTGP